MSGASTRPQMTLGAWRDEAVRRFGLDPNRWKFKCVRCKGVQSMADFEALGIKPVDAAGYLYFSCIGRFTKEKGCDWTLGGLFHIHKLEVLAEDGTPCPVFEFADPDRAPAPIPSEESGSQS